MAKLLYSTILSLDGYIADAAGNFELLAPDEEVHAAINDLQRGVGTYLYGRRLYDVMAVWEGWGDSPDEPVVIRDFAQMWRAADKVVYSRSLPEAATQRTRIEREFDPGEIRRMKATTEHDIAVGGPELAGQAIRAGLVDEFHLYICPVLLGGGKRALPDGVLGHLELLDERRFAGGVVHLNYGTTEP